MSKIDQLLNNMNKNVTGLQPKSLLDFNEEISSVDGIVKLTLGEPDFNTPQHVKEAAIRAIQSNDTHYSPAKGTMALREAISRYLNDKYGLQYDPKTQIAVTNGVSGGLFASLFAIISQSDEVILPSPFFSPYESDIEINGGKPVFIDTSDNEFHLSPEKLAKTLKKHPNAKAIMLNYPNNPTGASYSPEELRDFAEILSQYDIFILSDEIYSELSYQFPHLSMAHLLPDQTILLNGVSKSHAMTGWRIGYFAGPEKLVDQIAKVEQYLVFTADTISQDAATEALNNGENDAAPMKKEYIKRNQYLYQALKDLGFHVIKPEGAFYLFIQVPANYHNDDMQFSLDLAHQAKVAVFPGSFFGPGGEGYIRISYAASMDNLKEAVKRIKDWMQK